MELKTKIKAEDGKQELAITREFDLPVELLFKAHVEPEILEQWMGTRVLKLEGKKHGSYQFETTDPKGNKHRFNVADQTFEARQMPGVDGIAGSERQSDAVETQWIVLSDLVQAPQ